jgi:hypothetical protein
MSNVTISIGSIKHLCKWQMSTSTCLKCTKRFFINFLSSTIYIFFINLSKITQILFISFLSSSLNIRFSILPRWSLCWVQCFLWLLIQTLLSLFRLSITWIVILVLLNYTQILLAVSIRKHQGMVVTLKQTLIINSLNWRTCDEISVLTRWNSLQWTWISDHVDLELVAFKF